jgi:hypothetical protein
MATMSSAVLSCGGWYLVDNEAVGVSRTLSRAGDWGMGRSRTEDVDGEIRSTSSAFIAYCVATASRKRAAAVLRSQQRTTAGDRRATLRALSR